VALLLEQVNDQEYKDALALRRLCEDEDCWGALERLVKRLGDDVIQEWTNDEAGQRTKKWLKGSREMCAAFLPAIEQTAQLARDVIAEKQELENASRSEAADGLGSGDLSI
jgi:hypothetical protein